jgi:hypothetical protein
MPLVPSTTIIISFVKKVLEKGEGRGRKGVERRKEGG